MIIMVMTNVDKNDVLNDETYADRNGQNDGGVDKGESGEQKEEKNEGKKKLIFAQFYGTENLNDAAEYNADIDENNDVVKDDILDSKCNSNDERMNLISINEKDVIYLDVN